MMPVAPRRNGAWTAAGIFVFGAAGVVIVLLSLLLRGPFAWHFQQSEAWQGGLEAALLFALVFLAFTRLQRRPRWHGSLWLLLLPVALYLRRHHVDAVLVIVIAYLEGLLAVGAALQRLCRSEQRDDWLRNLIAGIVVFSLLLWLAQLAGLGTPRAQRLLALLVMVPAVWIARIEPLSWRLLRAAVALESPAARAWAALLATMPLVLLARTNAAIDYDSLWYGLRLQLVLVGDHSVFDALGFASPVHYFPKLYEVLLLPLAAMREDSVLQGATVMLGALLALLVHRMLRRVGLPELPALAATAAVWTIPALGAASLGTKPDVISALGVLAMVWFTWNIAGGRRADGWWVFACAALAVSSKLLAFAYVGAAGLACSWVCWPGRHQPAQTPRLAPVDVVVAIAACAVGVLVALRTHVLAGMPTVGPEQLVTLWRWLGMELRAPVGTMQWLRPQTLAELPGLFIGWVADPTRFSHLQVTWPSNLWLFLPVLAWCLRRPATASPSVPAWLWAVPLMGLALVLGIGFINRGGDGNYFIAPVALASVAGFGLVWPRLRDVPARRALIAVLVMYVLFQFAYAFVSASWSIGTRRWDLDFTRPNRDSSEQRQAALAAANLEGVADYLRQRGGTLRVSGRVPSPTGFQLPARYEDLADIGYAHRILPTQQHRLRQMLACAQVEAMLLPIAASPTSPYLAEMQAWTATLPASARLYEDGHWRLVNLRGQLPACAD